MFELQENGRAKLSWLVFKYWIIKQSGKNCCVHSSARPPLRGPYQDTPTIQGMVQCPPALTVLTSLMMREREGEGANICNQMMPDKLRNVCRSELRLTDWRAPVVRRVEVWWLFPAQPLPGLLVVTVSICSYWDKISTCYGGLSPLSFRWRNKQMNIITTL